MNFNLRCCLHTFVVLLFATPLFAQSNISLANLISKSKEATISRQPYSVNMVQDIRVPSTNLKAKSTTSEKITNYQLVYHPGKNVVMNPIDSNTKTVSSSKKSASFSKPNIQIYVDLNKLFKSSTDWENYKIKSEDLDNNSCYKISAEYKKFEFTIWIDKTDYFVSKVVLDINHVKFSETNLQYKKINDVWLPTRISIAHANGTIVNQIFNSYNF